MAKQSNKPKTTQNTAKSYTSPAAKTPSSRQTGTRSTGERQTTSTQNMRTAVRRQEREREKRRQQYITIGIVVAAIAIVAVFVFAVVNAPAEAPIPAAALARYEGVEQSNTTEGYPRLGDPNASVQVAEYSSFDCPHCREFHDTAIQRIVDRVKQGGVAFTYVPLYGYGSFANGQGAAAAAVCVAEQGKFWEFHDALFDWQGQYGNQAFTNNRISSGVDALTLDRGAYNACISSSRPTDVLTSASTQARSLLNFGGTPTIAINGVVVLDGTTPSSNVDTILARIESEVARLGSSAPVAQPTTQPEPTTASAATAEATDAAAATNEAPASAVATDEATPETTPAS